MHEEVGQALDRDLARAAEFPAQELASLRHRVFCSDDDGYMLIPSFGGDPIIGRKMFEAIDIHQHAPCPLQRWLQEEMRASIHAAEKQLNRAISERELEVRCIGGKRGIDPELYEVTHNSGQHVILIGHVFYHVMLVLARACAARVRIHKSEEYNKVSAKEINDSLRDLATLYVTDDAAPRTDAIAAKLLAHQLLAAERLARSFRRFIIARGIGQIIYWQAKTDPQKSHLLNQEFSSFGQIPPDLAKRWSEDITCDLSGYILMRQAAETASADGSSASPGMVQVSWDFAAVRLWLTARDYFLRFSNAAGRPMLKTDTPVELRMSCLDSAFPPWSRPLGNSLSRMISHRMSALFDLGR